MKLEEFDYELPPEKIAQRPVQERDSSRLLVLARKTKNISHCFFRDMPSLLEKGDVLVINDSRVMPGRLVGEKPTGGRCELTIVGKSREGLWECLVKTRKPGPGTEIFLPAGLTARIVKESGTSVRTSAKEGAPLWLLEIEGDLEAALQSEGLPPLPPYIKRTLGHDPAEDKIRYQTVYAGNGSSSAAPTAGLHFTPGLLERLAERGVTVARIRLDVGFGTFSPVRAEEIEDHVMHPESYQISGEAAETVNRARRDGGRVVAVGTTVTRTLEYSASPEGLVSPGAGETALFIYPGYRFKVVDAMITNFHMPKSTLIMLVSAFAGRDFVMESYKAALAEGYRFLSYGDAMLIH